MEPERQPEQCQAAGSRQESAQQEAPTQQQRQQPELRRPELKVESSDSPAKPEDYVTVGGYRLVKPYHFDFCCSVRQRWFGQNIIDIFSREFPARDRQYYLQALADGRLRVEGCQVTADTPLKDGQRMRHFIHRHEPPVPAGPIPVVGTSADMVAVCKPAGMPVHVAGQYRKNTVLGVLVAERPDLGPLFPIHRLDKPVSGLLLFARSAAAAAALCRKIEGREVEKVYVARVLGRFPEGPVVADVALDWDPVANMASAVPEAAAALSAQQAASAAQQQGAAGGVDAAGCTSQRQDAQQAGPVVQPQQGIEQAAGQQHNGTDAQLSKAEERRQRKQQKKAAKAAKAERQAAAAAAATAASANKSSRSAPKPALTEFRLLAVAEDGLTSIVECRPRTGRTHQIRVHLQHLGHPIANDTQYGGTYGGPLASRHMAQQLGVHWSAAAAGDGGQPDGNSGGRAGSGMVAAPAVPAALAVKAGAASSKRPRLEAGGAAAPALGAEQARAAGSDVPEAGPAGGAAVAAAQAAAQADEPQAAATAASQPAAATCGGEAAAAGDAYEQNAAFRSRPEFEVAAELRDSLCTHCPYYAPRDYPLDLRPLWLHARTYSCPEGSWSFETQLPEWAHPEWQPPSSRQ
ncbi:hypothetical protein ABPG77_004909 [Micractinium sp. CCAP 211/92]